MKYSCGKCNIKGHNSRTCPKKRKKRNPWKPANVSRHNAACAKKDKCRRKWAKIANAVLKATGDEGKAVRIANWQVKRLNLKKTNKK